MRSVFAQIQDLYYPPAPTTPRFDLDGVDVETETIADSGSFLSGIFDSFFALLGGILAWLWSAWQIVALIFSILLIIGIIYSLVGITRIREKERDEFDRKVAASLAQATDQRNPRWEHVLSLASTEDPNNWRLAVLEADIMLADMLDAMGYRQDSLGEKLSAVDPGDFVSLDDAWEAHKIRNKIAHEGSNFVLTKRELMRVLRMYESAFKEYRYI